MSAAAEKLDALAAIAAKPSEMPWIPNQAKDQLVDALPQLIEVARAAEINPTAVYQGIVDEQGRPTGRIRHPLVEALAALDAALGER